MDWTPDALAEITPDDVPGPDVWVNGARIFDKEAWLRSLRTGDLSPSHPHVAPFLERIAERVAGRQTALA